MKRPVYQPCPAVQEPRTGADLSLVTPCLETGSTGPMFRATATKESPCQGSSGSMRLHSQTVLSKSLRVTLLILLRRNNRLKIHHGGAPSLLKLMPRSI